MHLPKILVARKVEAQSHVFQLCLQSKAFLIKVPPPEG